MAVDCEWNTLGKTVYKGKFIIYRLDQILGKQGSKAKDVYASKISLASRIVKVERQVNHHTTTENLYYLKAVFRSMI